MEISMKENGLMENKMVKERKIILMEGLCMWDIGRMGIIMVKKTKTLADGEKYVGEW
jgi:hypothetical protein